MDNRIEQVFKITRANIDAAMKELCNNRVNKSDISKKGGIYAFWSGEKAVYVGRAKNILRRYKQHLLCEKNQSPLALKLAKESLAKEGEEKGIKYLLPHYGRSEKENDIRKKIEKRLKHNDIKECMEAMEFSFIEEENTLQQCLLEIFCSIGLNTMGFNEEEDEEENIKKAEENGKIYYRYSFYNSFKTS